MIRFKTTDLINWKESPFRKPLIVKGARQTGKTWLMKEFAKTQYEQSVYVNFEENPVLKSIFSQDFNIPRIIDVLEIFSGVSINAQNTLLIFDEIQEAEKGITSLKYFCENAPELHVMAAGSLLGVSFHHKESFPVGKVDILELHPLSFSEFLLALNENKLVKVLQNRDWPTLAVFHDKLTNFLKYYLYVGGMPEAVSAFITTKDWQLIRQIQNRLLISYQGDFSKHAPYEIVPRMQMVWKNIVAQLSKENKKFIYGIIREGARAKDFELALQWLTDSGLIIRCQRITKPEIPLNAYTDLSAFKIYLLDTGLLLAMAGIDHKSVIDGNYLFNQFNGAIAEQFVLQQLTINTDRYTGYWTNDRNTSEIDFIFQENGRIIPVEVKSGESLRSKSFKLFCEKYNPSAAVRLSLSGYQEQGWMTNVPLWGAEYCLPI